LAIIIGRFVYKELTVRDFSGAIVISAARVGTIFWIAANAILFGFFVTKLGIPVIITDYIIGLDLEPWQFLLVVNVVLVIIGFFLEGVPTILIFMPILFPAAQAIGIDPVHFGIIVVVNIELGLITPPVGLNLFVGASISGLSVVSVFRATLPWMISTVVTLGLVTYIPTISLFLPSFMKF
jgi:C4-dicarboxylate transporter DctM subunit